MSSVRRGAFVSAHAIQRSAQQHQGFVADVEDALTSFRATLQAMLVRASIEQRRHESEQDMAEDSLRRLEAQHNALADQTRMMGTASSTGWQAASGRSPGLDTSLREGRLRVQLAGQRHAAATGAVRLLEAVIQDFARATSAYRNRIRSLEEQSQRDLGFFFAAVESYTALASVGSMSAPNYTAQPSTASLQPWDPGLDALAAGSFALSGRHATALSGALADRGMALIPTDQCSFTNNPITSWAKTAKSDIMWACETWETKIAPAFAGGVDREAWEAKDRDNGVEPVSMRRSAGVWDTFLGNDPIVVRPQADGSFYVENGRHRVQAFQELGIKHLPARIAGGPG